MQKINKHTESSVPSDALKHMLEIANATCLSKEEQSTIPEIPYRCGNITRYVYRVSILT